MFKNKKFSVVGLLFNVLIGLAIGLVIGINPVYTVVGSMAIGATMSFVKLPQGILRAGVFKELWLDLLMENFYPDSSFLSRCRDMSALVDYNTLHLAEIGVDPNVLIDNTSYPIATAQRTDTALELPLSTFDTENTLVRNVEELETAYDKMASVLRQHRNALQKKASTLAAYNWAPQANSALTPVNATTGATNPYAQKAITFDDIIRMMGTFDDMDLPVDGRTMILCPRHRAELMAEDIKMYKQVMSQGELFGFRVYTFSKNPAYSAAGAKAAFEAAGNPATIFYHEDEVMRAQGTQDMFVTYKSPEQRGDIVGFQMRFAALSIRGKYSGAIYSA